MRFIFESANDYLTGDVTILTTPTSKTFTCHIVNAHADTGGYFEALTDIYESTGTTVYTEMTVTETGSPDYGSIVPGHKISSYQTSGSIIKESFARVTNVVDGALTVSEWSNGIPTGGNPFRIDGWVVDLPRCQSMPETFDPVLLIHELYDGPGKTVVKSKMCGWKYSCLLDYTRYLSSDVLYEMRKIFSQNDNDDLILIPRRDTPRRIFRVFWANKIECVLAGRSPGYKKVAFEFNSIENISQPFSLGDHNLDSYW